MMFVQSFPEPLGLENSNYSVPSAAGSYGVIPAKSTTCGNCTPGNCMSSNCISVLFPPVIFHARQMYYCNPYKNGPPLADGRLR
jgi:hypothetical protein